MKQLSQVFILLLFGLLSSCNNQDKMLEWVENIPINTSIEEVKKSQPTFIKVNWEDPLIHNDDFYYSLDFKYNNDILQMEHLLVFDKNYKFKTYSSRK